MIVIEVYCNVVKYFDVVKKCVIRLFLVLIFREKFNFSFGVEFIIDF